MSRRGRHRQVHDYSVQDHADEGISISADRGIYYSSDGLRRTEELLNVAHKKRRVQPSDLDDSFAQWVPVPEDGFNADEGEDQEYDEGTVQAESADPTTLGKRKEYVSTRDPVAQWRPLKGMFLDEIVRHEGLGDDFLDPRCSLCDVPCVSGEAACPRFFKCKDCGQFLQCEACCLSHHARSPLHVVQEWNGQFWAPVTLAGLGLVYQLGHGGGPCEEPDERIQRFVVIEAPVIHEIRVRYCKCPRSDYADNLQQLLRNGWYPATVTDPGTCATFKTLEALRLYMVIGNMNVKDFITALERMTDTTASSGMTWLPNRYKQLQRMARQWAFLKRLERSGRAHDNAGVGSTKLGECAVRCWPCPHDGRNLVEGWEKVDPKLQFLYMLLLAVDANFRLKNRMRPKEIDDPPLGPGWGYWVEPEGYREHLSKYVNEKDISTCIAFAALLQKDTRMTTGLRCSGVGGCVCARHECMRPNGLGDLQKGERYANMDYIVMSALVGFALRMLTVSYDIACQWKINLRERMKKLPPAIRLDLSKIKLQCGLPVWHAASHNDDCANENSLSFKPGVGKTDGEGIERTWSGLNPVAYSTKDAGKGQRADVIEDNIDNHNYLKNVGQGETLQRRLVIAIAERDRQVKAFKLVSAGVEDGVMKEWRGMIDAWLKDPSNTNPYLLSRKDCPTEAQVRVEVRKDEEALTASGRAPLHGHSATAFLTAGIQIEDAQQRIEKELVGTALLAADRDNQVREWRHALLVKIEKFRNLQKVYMPGAGAAIQEAEQARDTDAAPPRPEKVQLFMPSEMVPVDASDALRGCVSGLVEMEAKLRVGQCTNSLVGVRARLHAKRHIIGFRDSNIAGQIQATRARTLIDEIGERVDFFAKHYRRGRKALVALKGEAAHPNLRELKAEDVSLDGDTNEPDAAARAALTKIGSGRGSRNTRNAPGTSRRIMSWIWTAPGALDDEELQIHESVRVEWARARARKLRWTEEVMLLREEMRRVLRYLEWQAAWWKARVGAREDVAPEIEAGIKAYALKQESWHLRLAASFQKKWTVAAGPASRSLLDAEGRAMLSAEEGPELELDQFYA